MEILENYDEWSIYDYKLAQRILKDRGKEVSKTRLEELKKNRLDLLKVPGKAKKGWLIFGLFFSLFGGLTGIIIGLYHLSVKTLPDGERVYLFEEPTRKLSRILLYVGLFFFISELILFIFKSSY